MADRETPRGKRKAGPKRKRYEPKTSLQALGYLVEECGEVLHAAGKSIRWGLDNYNPEIPVARRITNAEWLSCELADLEAAIERARRICELPK